MKNGIIFNIEKNNYSLINIHTNEVIATVGDIYKDLFNTERKREMGDIQRILKKLECEDFVKKCIERKTVFKFKYNNYRFVIGGIACSGQWYTTCLDYVNHSVAVCTQYHEITKNPLEIGDILIDN
ncbi:hypothetical protein PMX22_20735 [Clostridium butyricum]|uniref:hypothetical protein n=1 Tax=Clostridium butyricum TaxID=1492 RepID=UPI00232B6DF6|nr:hypothetical protein [Clostridium butyricum]MDB2162210.1 hypothetical protein [Clostridium butyricum]